MNLVEKIKNEPTLQPFIVDACAENGLCVEFSNSIAKADYVILKVDAFYNSCEDFKDPETKLMTNTPPSVDCLIVLACKGGTKYRILLVELKNTSRKPPKENMVDKFRTTIHDFMSERYRDFFYDLQYELELDLYMKVGKLKDGLMLRSLKPDYALGLRPIFFGSKRHYIEELPAVIHSC